MTNSSDWSRVPICFPTCDCTCPSSELLLARSGPGFLSALIALFAVRLHRHEKATRICHARDSRGPEARPFHWRGDDADLCNVDVRAGKPGKAQGLRLFTLDQSDPARL